MTVYLVIGEIHFEGDTTLGVYSTFESANAERERLVERVKAYRAAYDAVRDAGEDFDWEQWEDIDVYTSYDEFSVHEWEVQ